MKSIKFLFLGMMTLSFVLAGCNGDDDPPKPVDPVEDGIYLTGASVASEELTAGNRMQPGVIEGAGYSVVERAGLYQQLLFISKGVGFHIVEVKGASQTTYGANLETDLQKPWADYGDLKTNAPGVIVGEDGLYFVYVDLQADSKKIFVLKANDISVTGDGVGGADIRLEKKDAFSKTKGEWEATGVNFKKDWWKLRMNRNWTYLIAEGVPVFTNLGGDSTNLSPGGANLDELERGKYTVKLKYEFGKGFSVTTKWTGDSDAPIYPEALYMIGADFGNWDWKSDDVVEMIPVTGIGGAFWCINYFTAAKGFKWSPVKDWDGSFGRWGENVGFENDGDGNAIIAEDGLYSVYIDMAADKITIEPAQVYGKGNCFGGWGNDENPVAPLPFTLSADGKTMSITAIAEDELRMYAGFSEASKGLDWWRAEFIILDGKIVYRGNSVGEQERVRVAAGKTITLDFKAGTGAIE